VSSRSRADAGARGDGDGDDGLASRILAGLVAGGSTKPVLAASVLLLLLLAVGFLVAGLLFLLG
jgi:hypothetical protein